MKLFKTNIDGLRLCKFDSYIDNRGTFTRLFCENELRGVIQDKNIVQINYSITNKIGTGTKIAIYAVPTPRISNIIIISFYIM